MKKTKILSFLMGGIICLSMTLGSVQPVYGAENSVDAIFVSETSYEDTMKTVVEPYVNSKKESGYMDVNEPDFKIYYEKYKVPNSKGNIVISHGFTESLEKYHELIYYFLNEGYSVYGLEHRGHGRSGHLGKVDPTQVNVGSFDDYVSDLKSFLDTIVKPETQEQKLFLFAHSMGGGIGTRFLEQYNDYFDAAILSSPMLHVNTKILSTQASFIISSAALLPKYADKYVTGLGAYKSKYNFAHAYTTCESRYAYSLNVKNSNPEIQRGGPSFRWAQRAIACTVNNRTFAAYCTTPVLLFQAENDGLVLPDWQDEFAQNAQNCTLVKVPNAKHELYMEKDEILKPYLEKVMDFYEQY